MVLVSPEGVSFLTTAPTNVTCWRELNTGSVSRSLQFIMVRGPTLVRTLRRSKKEV